MQHIAHKHRTRMNSTRFYQIVFNDALCEQVGSRQWVCWQLLQTLVTNLPGNFFSTKQ